jgi:hypothetical protein
VNTSELSLGAMKSQNSKGLDRIKQSTWQSLGTGGFAIWKLIRLTYYIMTATQQPAMVKYSRHISFVTSFRTEK